MTRTWHFALGAMLLLLFSGGCSIKLAYNNADRLIRWNVDDYVDLTRPQKRFLTAELERLLYWHRTTQLPQYASALERLNNDIANAVGGPDAVLVDDFNEFIETALLWGEVVEAKAHRTASQILLSMTAEQIRALPALLEKDNRKLLKDEEGKTLLENQARWEKEVRKGLQRFMGRLNKEQKSFLHGQAQQYEPERVLWVDYRRRWQAEMLRLLQQRMNGEIDSESYVVAFEAHSDAREEYYGEFGGVWERNQTLGVATAAGLLVRMQSAQQARFFESVEDIAEDLFELVEEAEPEPPTPLAASECLRAHSSCPGAALNALP
ncbi:MAG: DUF6279 family lipoprotein [Pseudomonadales bacterium]